MLEANANGNSAILIHNPALVRAVTKMRMTKMVFRGKCKAHIKSMTSCSSFPQLMYHLYVFLAAVASNEVIYKQRTGRHYCQGFIALLVFLIMTHSAPAYIWTCPQACRHMLAGISRCASLLCKCCCKSLCPHFS
jgi:hypothetical protein